MRAIVAGTRVRVASPQGSAFDGRAGVIVRSPDRVTAGTHFVRLDLGARGSVVVPFARAELERVCAERSCHAAPRSDDRFCFWHSTLTAAEADDILGGRR